MANFKKYYVVLYTRGENWVEGKSVYEQKLMDHGNFMAGLLKDGKLVISGPFTDSTGGMLVMKAENKEEVAKLIETDPGVTNGVFKAEIKEWHVAFEA